MSSDGDTLPASDATAAPAHRAQKPSRRSKVDGYLYAVVGSALVAIIARWSREAVRIEGAIMLYLLAVVAVATRFGLGPAILSAVLGVVAVDYVVMPPTFELAIGDLSQALMLLCMVSVATVVSGLTERLRRQEERARALAVDAEKTRSEIEKERVRAALLSSVSHDLRTPLAMISSSAQVLSREHERMAPALRAEIIRAISEQADRLDSLLANLLAMTRVESGDLRPRTLPSSIAELVSVALTRSTHLLEARRVESVFATDLPLVDVDGRLLEQVFINVLENAVRYSPEGSPIGVVVERTPTGVAARIEDEGTGVPADELDLIFQKFRRGSNAPRSDGGVGLGLTICRAIVEAHGGTIELRNRPEGGAVVTITLPESTATLAAAAHQLPPVP
ncbi:MAG TPA: ATP-binding protein [Polyangiaceae bacterium]|nr:ATP-binding protein [Polyangiaceae bacterium]